MATKINSTVFTQTVTTAVPTIAFDMADYATSIFVINVVATGVTTTTLSVEYSADNVTWVGDQGSFFNTSATVVNVNRSAFAHNIQNNRYCRVNVTALAGGAPNATVTIRPCV